ncbi:molybdenum cofactor guanylyltransferase [Cohnella cholangitidis]|uniref:Probable molybdenum cofactor guanylyltransferase n=1 Tax=Cohnella cholangitidis TaxID=2598458 RepID=A0A7G5C5M7_9BACL|nr:molybdenum cofactor guanylyltransferase [Cohnella cholangitidis]QMV44511.1 molybdenum cofactor guanylyltransferase [Cohnella cholangitidis]
MMLDIADIADLADPLLNEGQETLSGVILAGGKSRRIGGAHIAMLPFSNEKLIHRQIRHMKKLCAEIIVVTNEPRTFLPIVDSDIRIITDFYHDKGPLGGMHAAFSLAAYSDVWLVGCDMPYVSYEAARLLLEKKRDSGCDAALPFIKERLHPWHGIYDRRCVEIIPSLIDRNQSRVDPFLHAIRYEGIVQSSFESSGIDASFVTRMSTQEEYERTLFTIATSGKGCS